MADLKYFNHEEDSLYRMKVRRKGENWKGDKVDDIIYLGPHTKKSTLKGLLTRTRGNHGFTYDFICFEKAGDWEEVDAD